MGSVFDPPPGVMKGDGQMHQIGGGAAQAAPQQGAPQPVVPGQPAAQPPADPGMISSLIAALAKAFAPKSITDRGKNIEQGISQNDGGNKDSLGSQF